MTIDRENFVPIYYQIGEQIRQAIEAGIYKTEEKLSSEEALADKFKVSRKTIRLTLDKLVKEGYVTRVKGKGTFVSSNFNKRKIISVILDKDFSGEYHRSINDLLGGIIMNACPAGCEVQLNTNEQVPSILERQRAGKGEICGFILLRYCEDKGMSKTLEKIKKSGMPFLLEGISLESENYVDIDNKTPMKQAVEYLAGLGHRHIGILSASEQRGHLHFDIRKKTAIETIREMTGEFNTEWNFEFPPCEDELIENKAKEYLSRTNLPTAFISVSDTFSMIFLQQAKKLGFKIPQDFSITGFDDIAEIKMMEPSLTTFKQDYFLLGKTSAEKLLQMSNNANNRRQQTKLIPEFIIRESCGKPSR